MVSMNINILGISELKWMGMAEFNSDDHYIYYCGKNSLRIKELKLRQSGPLQGRGEHSWSILCLSLVHSVSCLRTVLSLGADGHTAQCLTHGNAFLRLYVNDYNKSCLGTCFSRLVPLSTQQQCISPRHCQSRSLWLILCLSYRRMYALGKGLVELLQP